MDNHYHKKYEERNGKIWPCIDEITSCIGKKMGLMSKIFNACVGKGDGCGGGFLSEA